MVPARYQREEHTLKGAQGRFDHARPRPGAEMHISRILLGTGLVAAAMNTFAAGAGAEIPQQLQLNRASQQELREIQAVPGPPQPPISTERPWRKRSLDREQQLQQGTLQEHQRREVLMQKQRAKTTNRAPSRQRLDAIDRQQQHRSRQQQQLNRFRTQQRRVR